MGYWRLQIAFHNYSSDITTIKFAHTEPLMKTSNILQVKDLYIVKVLQMLYQDRNDEVPPPVKSMQQKSRSHEAPN